MKDTLFEIDQFEQPVYDDAPEMIVDNFAGGGGASTGIELALGRSPDVAINHDPVALAMHEANHPETLHMTNSIYAVDPRDVVPPGRKVGLAWFSPDCKHHSKAKGGKPVEKNIRDLAWVVVHWAELVQPRVIMLENVEEFQDWCPLTPDNKPDRSRLGETFRAWVKRLRRLGYKVEWKELRACDYGAPTIRKRLFVIARCDGKPIVWPEPTHGALDSKDVQSGRLKPWRTAAEIIDWSLPCPSIFDSSEEIKAKYGLRAVRPLRDATLRRIARGVMKYVVEAKEPFIVGVGGRMGQSPERGISKPVQTLTTKADSCVVVPSFAPFSTQGQHGGHNRPIDAPHHTITASTKDYNGIVVPTLVQTGYGERPGQAPRVPGLDKPIGTMVAGGAKHAVVAAFLAQHNGGERMKKNAGRAASEPLSTITTRGTQQTVIAASMMNMHGASRRDASIEAPHPTLCAGGQHSALVAAFLQKYYGQGVGQEATDPLHTLSTRDTFGVVTVEIDGETYAIADIGMRMLTPREQFRAQGFPDSYEIESGPDGRTFTKTEQTRMCGNSVCPPLAAALAQANVPDLAMAQEAAA